MQRNGEIRGTVELTGALLAMNPNPDSAVEIRYFFYEEGDGGLERAYISEYASRVSVYPDLERDNVYRFRIAATPPGIYHICAAAPIVSTDESSPDFGQVYTECYDDALLIDEATDIEVAPDRLTQNISITLGDSEQYATVSGQVTNERGEPLDGMRVEATRNYDERVFFPQLYPVEFAYTTVYTETDARGRYAIETLPPGTYRLQFLNYRALSLSDPRISYLSEYHANEPDFNAATLLDISLGDALEIDAQLSASGSITGTIDFGEAGVEYFDVELFRPDGSKFRRFALTELSDDGTVGRYRFDSVPSGRYLVRVRSGSLIKYYPNHPTPEGAEAVLVQAGEITRDINFPTVTQGEEDGAIEGRATLANGDPAASIFVGLYDDYTDHGNYQLLYQATTEANGRYRLSTPQPGTYRVCFGPQQSIPLYRQELPDYRFGCYGEHSDDSSNPRNGEDISVASGETVDGIDIQVQRFAQIRGSVRMEDGSPLSRAMVCLYRLRDAGSGSETWDTVDCNRNFDRASTLAYGFNVEPGTYRVQVGADSPYGLVRAFYPDVSTLEDATDIVVTNQEQLDNIDLTLPDPADASLSGAVTQKGEPLAGIRIELYYDKEYYVSGFGNEVTPLIYTTTDANGEYTIRALLSDIYTIRFVDPTGELTTRWYGGGFTGSSATAINLADGEARTGLDVEMGQFQFGYLPLIGR